MLTNIGVALCFATAIVILVWIVRRVIRRKENDELALAELAPQLGLSPAAGTGVIKVDASGFTSSLFTRGLNRRTDHALETRIGGLHVVVFNYTYEERGEDGMNWLTVSVTAFASPKGPLPLFVLQKKNLFSKLTSHKIHLENNPDFEQRFVLTGSDSGIIQQLFGSNLAGFLLSTKMEEKFVMEGSGPWLVLWRRGDLRADRLRSQLEETSQIAAGFFQNCRAIQPAKAG